MLDSSAPISAPRPDEPGYLLSAVLITPIVVLFGAYLVVGGPPDHLAASSGTIILGLYLMTWGFMFLVSYYFSHRSIFLRGLIWICEHSSWPAGRRMAFFYFALGAFGGGIVVLKGLGLV